MPDKKKVPLWTAREAAIWEKVSANNSKVLRLHKENVVLMERLDGSRKRRGLPPLGSDLK